MMHFILENACKAIGDFKEIAYTGCPYDKFGNHFSGEKHFRNPVIGKLIQFKFNN